MPLEILPNPCRRAVAPAVSSVLVALLGSLATAADREPPARIYIEVRQPLLESLHRLPPLYPLPLASRRPAFATLEAGMANWDADAGFDGWVATVQVFDAAGQPVMFSGNASFELTPRVPSADLTSFLAVPDQRLRWTTSLATDAQGCATLRLPLRRSLPRTGGGHAPVSALLRVRVAIASEGVYEAESVVAIRPLAPLETIW